MSKISVFEAFANKGRKAANKALRETANISHQEANSILKNFKRETHKAPNWVSKDKDYTKVTSITNKNAKLNSNLKNGEHTYKINNNPTKKVTLENGSQVTGKVFDNTPRELKNLRGEKFNFVGSKDKTASFSRDYKYHKDYVKNNTKAYQKPSKDAPKLGSFDNQKKYTLINNKVADNKESNFLKNAVPTAVGGAMIFTMMNRRGQQSNSQLYGQQTPYQ